MGNELEWRMFLTFYSNKITFKIILLFYTTPNDSLLTYEITYFVSSGALNSTHSPSASEAQQMAVYNSDSHRRHYNNNNNNKKATCR